jgi:hypothetical protein
MILQVVSKIWLLSNISWVQKYLEAPVNMMKGSISSANLLADIIKTNPGEAADYSLLSWNLDSSGT